MEQSRTFVIILIVSIAAAVIIAVGLLLFAPQNPENVADTEPDTFDPYEFISEPEDNVLSENNSDPEEQNRENQTEDQGESQANGQPQEQANIITGILPAGSPEIPPLSAPLILRQPQVFGQEESTPQSNGITITQAPRRTEDQTQALAQTSRASESTPAPTPALATTTTVIPIIPPASTGTSQLATQSRATTASPQTARKVDREVTEHPQPPLLTPRTPIHTSNTEYWIQLFSSTNHQTVLDLSSELNAYSIQTKVSSRILGETTHFRLRFGPFEIMNEAEKFLTWIRQLEKYSSAYISQEIRQ